MNINAISPFGTDQKGTGAQSALDKNAFLQLLTAQLQHQDPLNPAEDVEFIQQLTEFASLEQLQLANENLGIIEIYQASINNSNALNLLGKQVQVIAGDIDHSQGESHEFDFLADPNAESTRIQVLDSQGNVVHETNFNGPLSGKQDFTWDGLDQDGNQADDGIYYLSVTQEYADGETVQAPVFQWMRVDGLSYEGGTILLNVGDLRIPIETVTEVQNGGGSGLKTAAMPHAGPQADFLAALRRY